MEIRQIQKINQKKRKDELEFNAEIKRLTDMVLA